MPRIGNGIWGTGDCFELMARLPDASVDMVLADLPYGTTACKWDAVLPLELLWKEYRRVCCGAIVLTAAQPFTSALISSNFKDFRYCWYWNKTAITGFANAKKQPLRNVEDIAVFYQSFPTYNPQGLLSCGITKTNGKSVGGESLRSDIQDSADKGSLRTAGSEYVQEFTNYPRQTLVFGRDKQKDHPTQKPVPLFEYLIRTYTNEGDTVLDNTAGSGTTAIAAENAKRKWICIERDPEYAAKAMERIKAHVATLSANSL